MVRVMSQGYVTNVMITCHASSGPGAGLLTTDTAARLASLGLRPSTRTSRHRAQGNTNMGQAQLQL